MEREEKGGLQRGGKGKGKRKGDGEGGGKEGMREEWTAAADEQGDQELVPMFKDYSAVVDKIVSRIFDQKEAEQFAAKWEVEPSPEQEILFHHWPYISPESINAELATAKADGSL